MKWISEAEKLPPIAQKVLLAHPRQSGEFWDLRTAQILVQYEGVAPVPVKRGDRWPTTYWWGAEDSGRNMFLVTGNSWWALLDDIPLPPGAVHAVQTGPAPYHFIAQPELVWIGQRERGAQ
jgi:hypothetical protein